MTLGKFREHRFDGVDDADDRPLIAQFCGNDPDTVVSHFIDHHPISTIAYLTMPKSFEIFISTCSQSTRPSLFWGVLPLTLDTHGPWRR